MKTTFYPHPLSDSTDEVLNDNLIKEYRKWIKLHLKFKLKNSGSFTDGGYAYSIDFQHHSYLIYENFKIELYYDSAKVDIEQMNENTSEIKAIIEKYYPKIYEKRY